MKRRKKINADDLVLDDDELCKIEEELMIMEDNDLMSEDSDIIEEDIEEDIEDEDISENVKTPKNKKKFYIMPKEFDTAIMEYYSSGVLTNQLAEMVDKIAQKLSFAPNFINYSFKSEMIGDAIVKMMKALIGKKYQHNKGSNPFSYFTRIAFNAFRNRIKMEKKSQQIHEKYREELMMFSEQYNTIVKNKNIKISGDGNLHN